MFFFSFHLSSFFFPIFSQFLRPNLSMKSVTKNWSCLSLSKQEGPGCCLLEDLSSQEFIIAAKFLTKRALSVDAIVNTFNPFMAFSYWFQSSKSG